MEGVGGGQLVKRDCGGGGLVEGYWLRRIGGGRLTKEDS
jgi:hypothetical protein